MLETLLLDPLGALVVTFFVMGGISILGTVFMFLTKNKKWEKGIFYGLSIWALIVAYCTFLGTYSVTAALVLAALTVAAVVLDIFSKKESHTKISRVMTTAAVVAGMVIAFGLY